MRKFIAALIAAKLVFLGLLALLIFSGGPNIPVNSQTETRPAQKVRPETDDNINRKTSDPYSGDFSRFDDRKNRAADLQIERVMDLLKIKAGSRVADIGAGGGWFSAIAAKRVGSAGIVYAIDINEDAIKYINKRKIREDLPNVLAILSKPDDPLLPKDGSVDAVLILNTYHEVAEPVKLLKNLRASLTEDALVGIIDRDGAGDDHGIDQKVIIEEAERAGFQLQTAHDFIKGSMDYFLIFRIAGAPANTKTETRQ